MGLLVLLTFCETPLWCLHTGATASRPWTFFPAQETCPAPDGGFIFLAQIPYIPVAWGCVIELLCYSLWLVRSLLNYEYCGHKMSGQGARLVRVRLAATVVALADTLVYLAIIFVPGWVPFMRLAPFCRLVHLATLDYVFKMLVLIPPVMLPFATIFVIYLGAFTLVAWVMCLLLDDVDTPLGRCEAQARLDDAANPGAYAAAVEKCPAVNAGFDSFSASFYTMMVASTNAGVPGQQVPAYSHMRIFGGLWAFSYFSINCVMLSLMLAVVYNAYAEALKGSVLASFRNRIIGLHAAYSVLRAEQPAAIGVTPPQMEALLAELQRCVRSGLPYVPPQDYKYLLSTLDNDSSGDISLREFGALIDVAQFSYVRVRRRSYPERSLPGVYRLLGVGRAKPFVARPATEGWGLSRILWLVLVVNAVSVIVASAEDYMNLSPPQVVCCTERTWGFIDMSFAIIYLALVGFRLLVEPFDRYWLSLQNRFDLFVTLVLFVTAMLWVSPFYLPREVLRFFNLLRLLQLLKLLSHVDFLSFIADCFVRISLGSLPILTLVYCASSVWAISGCQLWGGYVYGGNPTLQGSDLYEASMDVLNFNDFPSALMVFLGMIVTGGPFTEVIDAYATKSGAFLSGLFFMSYMYVIFFVFFNCFVSFVIDAFISRYELRKTDALVDAKQTESLRSLYATYHDDEYEVVASMRWEGSEELYKRMFADELEELHQSFADEYERDAQQVS